MLDIIHDLHSLVQLVAQISVNLVGGEIGRFGDAAQNFPNRFPDAGNQAGDTTEDRRRGRDDFETEFGDFRTVVLDPCAGFLEAVLDLLPGGLEAILHLVSKVLESTFDRVPKVLEPTLDLVPNALESTLDLVPKVLEPFPNPIKYAFGLLLGLRGGRCGPHRGHHILCHGHHISARYGRLLCRFWNGRSRFLYGFWNGRSRLGNRCSGFLGGMHNRRSQLLNRGGYLLGQLHGGRGSLLRGRALWRRSLG